MWVLPICLSVWYWLLTRRHKKYRQAKLAWTLLSAGVTCVPVFSSLCSCWRTGLPHKLATDWHIFLALSYVTECCFKSGGGGGGGGQKTTTTPPPSGHKLPCTLQETRRKNCRNGGTCFVVLLQNYRSPTCRYITLLIISYQSSFSCFAKSG